ncbi:MAG TPA: ABC transporter substrate-binding protein [archaeon]|nr:ABC transporter substrate-binding protein [archaeon]
MRICSIAKSNTEILHFLGQDEKIVGATSYDTKMLPGVAVVGSYTDIDVEMAVSLQPDIVFSSTFLQQKYVEQFEEQGIEVVHFDPICVDDIIQNILSCGRVIGEWDKASKLAQTMQNEIAAIQKSVQDLPKVKVYVEEWPRPPMAAGNWVVQMIELAGGIGILTQGERSREVTLTEVEKFNPEKIILNWCGIGKNADISLLKKRDGWSIIAAIAQDKIFAIDDSYFNTPSQNIVPGIELIAKILHGTPKVETNS